MAAYYNEIDPFAAQWLRNLIAAGLIAPGDVDERSIIDVRPDDLGGYAQCHFFAGLGGWSHALRLAGWPDDRSVWTGSCPCQPFSQAGKMGRFADDRHLWPTWVRLVEKRSPPIVFGEQVASATEWLRLVRGDLEALGYAVGTTPIEAASAGADHLRDRFWFVAHADDAGPQGRTVSAERAGERTARADGLADAHEPGPGEERLQRGRQQRGAGSNKEARDSGTVADANSAGPHACALTRIRRGQEGTGPRDGELERRCRDGDDLAHSDGQRELRRPSQEGNPSCEGKREMEGPNGQRLRLLDSGTSYELVIGADGKARRVKPGIRLLVNGVSGRVAIQRTIQQGAAEIQEEHWISRIGTLKGFGNAIDPRPAAAFIAAAEEAIRACAAID